MHALPAGTGAGEAQAMAESESFRIPRSSWILSITILLLIVGGGGAYLATRNVPEHGKTASYVGPKKCATCHERQAESWALTRMAQAFEVLKPGAKTSEKKMVGLDPQADYTRDPTCIGCHTTGYGRVGGFVSLEKTPDMAGVTCEACHGPGGRYARSTMEADPAFKLAAARKEGLVYPPKAAVCAKCHNANSPFVGHDYEFNYEERVRQGTHRHFELKYKHE